jgi:8-oxo-dGTP pyrophosphatase MutT (NUDIX family)
MKSKISVQKAGGGLVYNTKGEILFIFRNGKWDLPKGGIEKNEKIKQTAVREVEEETGVTGLEVVEKLPKTYHVFKQIDKRASYLLIPYLSWVGFATILTGTIYWLNR